MLVTEMLCPPHLRTPAWHSVIVRSAPSTSTQTVLPSSWHSEASLHSHAPLWAGKEARRAHGHVVAMASRGVPSMWWSASHGSACFQRWNPPPPGTAWDQERQAVCSAQNRQVWKLVPSLLLLSGARGAVPPSQELPGSVLVQGAIQGSQKLSRF